MATRSPTMSANGTTATEGGLTEIFVCNAQHNAANRYTSPEAGRDKTRLILAPMADMNHKIHNPSTDGHYTRSTFGTL